MDGLLTPVSTTYLRSRSDEPAEAHLIPVKQVSSSQPRDTTISSVDDALDALRSQPDYDGLITILKFFTSNTNSDGFSINTPGPKSAAVVQLLVTEIAPNYWALLTAETEDRDRFIACLRSLTGINALLSHIRVLVNESKTSKKGPPGQTIPGENSLYLGIFLDLLAATLQGDYAIKSIWESSIRQLSIEAQKRTQSQALLTLLASGRLISLTGEATSMFRTEQESRDSHWVGDGDEMSRWIGRNITAWAKFTAQTDDSHDQVQLCSALFQRSLSLGYPEQIMKLAVDELLLTTPHNADMFRQICLGSTTTTIRVLRFLLVHLSRKFLHQLDEESPNLSSTISAAAGIINSVLGGNESRKNILIDWCTASSGAGLGHPTAIRRAVLSVLAQDKEAIVSVFEKSLSQFGDELYIKHAAVLQQNGESLQC